MPFPLTNQVLDTRLDIALTLERAENPQRLTIIEAAVVAYGGSLIPAAAHSNWGPHFAELSLLGVSHTGTSTYECIANWIKAVIRTAEYDALVAA